MKTKKSTHWTPRAEARGMLRVNTERRFLPRFKNRGLAPSNVSFFTLGKIRNIGNIAISLFLVLVLMALPIAAQSQETAQSPEYTQGKTDGEHDAKGNTGYILGGFLCGLLTVLYCYLQEAAPPASALAGKSPQYVMGYLEAYKKTKRSRDASFAWAGYAIGCILNLVLFATGAYKIE